jgi:hypothetical protein
VGGGGLARSLVCSVLAAFAAATIALSGLEPCVTATSNSMPHFSSNSRAKATMVLGSNLGA